MRRTRLSASPGAAGCHNEEIQDQLPSNAVVDMFGRLFGTILATLFEGRLQTVGVSESTGRQLSDVFCDFLHDFRDPHASPSRNREHFGDREGATEDKGLDCDLCDLKARPSASSKAGRSNFEQIVELSGNPTLKPDGLFEYHILPFPERPVFDGLIAFLTRRCQGNPHDKGVIFAHGTPYDDQAYCQLRNAHEMRKH
jgi:hypothetical protein